MSGLARRGPVVEGEVVDDRAGRYPGRVLTHAPMFDPDDPENRVDFETDEMLAEGIPPSTRVTYNTQWRWVIGYCGRDDVPGFPREHMPMTVGTVRQMIKDSYNWTRTLADGTKVLAGRYGQPYSPETVALRVAVISIVHQWKGLASPTRHPSVAAQMRGYRKRWARAGFRPDISHALTPEENAAMCRSYDLRTVQGIRNAAMLRLQYELGARESEVCNLDRGDVRFITETQMVVHVVMAKGDKTRECAVEADTELAPDVCPVALVRRWLEVTAHAGFTDGKLFVQVNPGQVKSEARTTLAGTIRGGPVNRAAFAAVFMRAAKKAGVDVDPVTGERRHVTTHSARSGFITAAIDAGAQVAEIAPHTGHALESPVIHRYYRFQKRWGEGNNLGRRIRKAHRVDVGDR